MHTHVKASEIDIVDSVFENYDKEAISTFDEPAIFQSAFKIIGFSKLVFSGNTIDSIPSMLRQGDGSAL